MNEKSVNELKEEKDIEGLIDLLIAGDPKDRTESAKALGLIGDEYALSSLLTALDDENAEVRSNAAIAIGHIGSQKAVEKLIKKLDDESWVVRHDTAIALGQLGGDEVDEELKKALEKEEELEVKQKIIEALGEVGDEKTVDFLEKYKDDVKVVEEVVKALGNLGSERAVKILEEKVENGDKNTRELSVKALSSISSKESISALRRALKDDSWRIREEAAVILGNMNAEEAKNDLIDLLKDDSDYVIEAALKSLGKIGDKELIPQIQEKLFSEKSSLRSAAVETLGSIEDEKSLEILLDILKEEINPRVLWSVPDSLTEVLHLNEDIVKKEMKSYDDERRIILAVALGKSGQSRAINNLLEGVNHDSWKIRQKSVEALRGIDLNDVGKNRSKKVLKNLRKALSDNDKWVRVEAAKSLSEKIAESQDRIDVDEEIKALRDRLAGEGDDDVITSLKEGLERVEN